MNFSPSAAGQLVYQLTRGTTTDVWTLDRLDAAPRQLTNDGVSGSPQITNDGSKIMFNSRRDGGVPHVWMMDADGSNVHQVTRGKGEGLIAMAPDASWFLHASGSNEVWRATPAGQKTKFCDACFIVALSPDGQSIAYAYWKQEGARASRWLRVTSADGGNARLDIAWSNGSQLRWTRTGDALTYMRDLNGATNILMQPIGGGAGRQITTYKNGRIVSYAWLPDGRLILSRLDISQDAVLITNFR